MIWGNSTCAPMSPPVGVLATKSCGARNRMLMYGKLESTETTPSIIPIMMKRMSAVGSPTPSTTSHRSRRPESG